MPYACAVHTPDRILLYIDSKGPLWDTVLFDALNIPDIFLGRHIGILHASFISANGKAILFAGPKQVGKSTQAELWRNYRNAVIINGDRTGILVNDHAITACGIPFCGMSNICRNAQRPVAAIVFPQKSKNNAVSRLTEIESFKRLLGCLSYTHTDPLAQETAVRFAEKIAAARCCVQLACRPEKEAVDLLASALDIE